MYRSHHNFLQIVRYSEGVSDIFLLVYREPTTPSLVPPREGARSPTSPSRRCSRAARSARRAGNPDPKAPAESVFQHSFGKISRHTADLVTFPTYLAEVIPNALRSYRSSTMQNV